MLSYQHGYHAGNLADVHKHAWLAFVLAYLTRKAKPLSYIETHAGRGLYDLGAAEAIKTGEAAAGIGRAEARIGADHPLTGVLMRVRARHGAQAYPGSPLIAADLLRATDTMHLAELHPGEHGALAALLGHRAHIHHEDGLGLVNALLPPTPRRGILLIDPSYEVKSDYAMLARALPALNRKWAVGVVMLWYPLLSDGRHRPMLRALGQVLPDALRHEVTFPPARAGHGMQGSGLFMVNPPFGHEDEGARLDALFSELTG